MYTLQCFEDYYQMLGPLACMDENVQHVGRVIKEKSIPAVPLKQISISTKAVTFSNNVIIMTL